MSITTAEAASPVRVKPYRQQEARDLCRVLQAMRPDWDARGIMHTLCKESVVHTLGQVMRAASLAAEDLSQGPTGWDFGHEN
jgi:hypothetical protein